MTSQRFAHMLARYSRNQPMSLGATTSKTNNVQNRIAFRTTPHRLLVTFGPLILRFEIHCVSVSRPVFDPSISKSNYKLRNSLSAKSFSKMYLFERSGDDSTQVLHDMFVGPVLCENDFLIDPETTSPGGWSCLPSGHLKELKL